MMYQSQLRLHIARLMEEGRRTAQGAIENAQKLLNLDPSVPDHWPAFVNGWAIKINATQQLARYQRHETWMGGVSDELLVLLLAQDNLGLEDVEVVCNVIRMERSQKNALSSVGTAMFDRYYKETGASDVPTE